MPIYPLIEKYNFKAKAPKIYGSTVHNFNLIFIKYI